MDLFHTSVIINLNTKFLGNHEDMKILGENKHQTSKERKELINATEEMEHNEIITINV